MNPYIMNTYNRKPITFEKGEGIWLYDIDGNAYMDFVSGVAVNCLGHNHPGLTSALKNQVDKLMHVSNLYWTHQQMDLAQAICEKSGLASVFFCNSGTEALEGAYKISVKYGTSIDENKNKIIVLEKAFHGRTMGALSLTGNEKYQKPFGKMPGNIVRVPANDTQALKEVFDENVCAMILEPIQGEGGIYSLDKEYMKLARSLTETFGALLVFDEVQCGIGRTGALFAFHLSGVVPDVLCLAKGLGAGFPIGAVAVGKKADVLEPGDHGSTFGGNPLACSAGNYVLSVVDDPAFLSGVKKASDQIKQGLIRLDGKYDYLVEIRGEGLILGVETTVKSSALIEQALEEKLLLIGAGENTVRIIPPLNISESEVEIFVEKFENVLKNVL